MNHLWQESWPMNLWFIDARMYGPPIIVYSRIETKKLRAACQYPRKQTGSSIALAGDASTYTGRSNLQTPADSPTLQIPGWNLVIIVRGQASMTFLEPRLSLPLLLSAFDFAEGLVPKRGRSPSVRSWTTETRSTVVCLCSGSHPCYLRCS